MDRSLTESGGELFFVADDGTSGFELWKSDGTTAGTVLVKDINPGGVGSIPVDFTEIGGELFFVANDGTTGLELWVVRPNIEGIIARLQAIVDNNPGPCADKAQDALANAQSAFDEFSIPPPDNQAALGNIEGAVGDLEAALSDGVCPGTVPLTDLMDILAGIARAVTVEAIDDAIALGGDPVEISDAQAALAEGDAHRAAGQYKDAVAKYKDALAKAEGSV